MKRIYSYLGLSGGHFKKSQKITTKASNIQHGAGTSISRDFPMSGFQVWNLFDYTKMLNYGKTSAISKSTVYE